MPNYYAHLYFGERVLADLPNALGKLIQGEWESFALGCFGPDPLFFYQPLKKSEIWRSAGIIHRSSALPLVKSLRTAVEEDIPMSRGFAAGYICHLALDHVCHAYVEARAARPGEPSHYAMEGEFDRYLMVQDGYPMVYRKSLMPVLQNEAVWTAGSAMYDHVQPEQLKEAYDYMSWCVAKLASFYCRFRGRIIDAFSHVSPAVRGVHGMALKKRVGAGCDESNEVMLQLLLDTVSVTAREIAGFFGSIAREEPLSLWFDRDFKGNVFTQPEESVGILADAITGADSF